MADQKLVYSVRTDSKHYVESVATNDATSRDDLMEQLGRYVDHCLQHGLQLTLNIRTEQEADDPLVDIFSDLG